MNIKFSPPDISDKEIQQVAEALRSGWITRQQSNCASAKPNRFLTSEQMERLKSKGMVCSRRERLGERIRTDVTLLAGRRAHSCSAMNDNEWNRLAVLDYGSA